MTTFDLDAMPRLCEGLLTYGNPKTAKGEGFGFYTAVLHLAPASLSGRNVCSHATVGCRAACLNTAGRGGIGLDADGLNSIQVARIRRTRWFARDRDAFMAQLCADIRRHIRRAEKHGLKPAVRLNGTSDLPWENIAVQGAPNVFALFPDVQFYDYTKVPSRIRRRALKVANYQLTFSLADGNEDKARDAVAAGLNLAVVFDTRKGRDLPARFWGLPVVDGDISDLRFTDPSGCVVGLRAKGRAKSDGSGFVQSAALAA